MVALITTLSLLSTGLLTGSELAVAVFIHPILYRVPDQAHATVVRPLAAKLGRWMPFWYAASFLLALGQSLLMRHSPPASLAWFAVGLLAVIIVLSITLPVPINNRMARLDSQHLPANWLADRRRWDLYHQIRTLLLIAVEVLLILAAGRSLSC